MIGRHAEVVTSATSTGSRIKRTHKGNLVQSEGQLWPAVLTNNKLHLIQSTEQEVYTRLVFLPRPDLHMRGPTRDWRDNNSHWLPKSQCSWLQNRGDENGRYTD